MKVLRYCLLLCLSLAATSVFAYTWTQEMGFKLRDYTSCSEWQLDPYLHRAGFQYAPKHLAFLIFKNTKRLEIYARNNGAWHYVRTYPILAASGGPGPKLHEGDHQVPEGVYKIIGMNPMSHFDLSMHLNYPNAFDRHYARLAHRTDLGGDIFIHGNHRSIGCVAIGNDAIQQVFPLVYYTGWQHVEVIIAPDDLRIHPPIYGRVHPKWLPILYRKIEIALKPFPEPCARA